MQLAWDSTEGAWQLEEHWVLVLQMQAGRQAVTVGVGGGGKEWSPSWGKLCRHAALVAAPCSTHVPLPLLLLLLLLLINPPWCARCLH